MNTSDLLKICIQVSREAGSLILDMAQKPLHIDKKSTFDLVTNADKAANDFITQKLLELCPDSQVMAEEGSTLGRGLLWIVDPIDGTTNYARGIPHAAVSIGAFDTQRKELLVGCVFNPFNNECFWASKNQGAFLNDQPIHVSKISNLQDSIAASGYFNHENLTYETSNLPETYAFLKSCLGLRRNGAASLDLCWVAMGRFDIYWERGLHAWDVAAGALIVQEAGGKVTNYQGDSLDVFSGEILSSNSLLHEDSTRLLKTAKSYSKTAS
ncbi:MAG: inositol monophosphatase family protein [Myxococcaceae bacterium]